ncbi:class D sortase [Tepidibacter hydrothermalis]|uniref:Class D sortase n=1 Tax=Tepidibacter hydrothermalis TaxID=3036126 RepID=A0ABY8EE33_9FIRM|nr:class D sortase [Tepidibacter hydrothermalis]WFD11196.1 class D sortase [Tepidibacter hydrothermalis]
MKKSLGIIFIILGIIIVSYPHVKTNRNEKIQRKIVESVQGVYEEKKDIKQEVDLPKLENNNVTDILKIEKIDITLPILEDATKQNLNIAPCRILETEKPGEIGNCAIAGHRSYTYGKQFNRLDEIELGDKIQVLSKGKNYIYTVNSKFIVKPEDVWVLEGNGKDKMITLITCTPIRVGTHRLIIQGIIEEEVN